MFCVGNIGCGCLLWVEVWDVEEMFGGILLKLVSEEGWVMEFSDGGVGVVEGDIEMLLFRFILVVFYIGGV